MQRKDDYGGIPADEYPDWFLQVANNIYQILADNGSFLSISKSMWKMANVPFML